MVLYESSKHTWLHVAVLSGLVAFLYSKYRVINDENGFTTEQAVLNAWAKVIQIPPQPFKKMVFGVNVNVDVIVSGTRLLRNLNVTSHVARHHKQIKSFDQLSDVFTLYFTKGAPAERYTSDERTFEVILAEADAIQHDYSIGGNAALMANAVAIRYSKTQVILVGPIGPRAKALLHPSVVTLNSSRIAQDELHVIMEYKQGELWGEYVAPASSRFITSHNQLSASSIVIDMFFNTVVHQHPDLVIISGLHLLEYQSHELFFEKLRQIKRNIKSIPSSTPIHLEIASMSNRQYVLGLLNRVVPFVDSIGLNEQEMVFLSKVGGGPHAGEYPVRAASIHVHKAVDIIHWLMTTYGKDDSNLDDRRLSRVHFHCLTYHILAVRGQDWSNLGASVAAGARTAGRRACGLREMDARLLDMRIGNTFLLDSNTGRMYKFDPENPIASWMHDEILFVFTPALVCKNPIKTVGVDDAISAIGLVFSQFYRFGKTV